MEMLKFHQYYFQSVHPDANQARKAGYENCFHPGRVWHNSDGRSLVVLMHNLLPAFEVDMARYDYFSPTLLHIGETGYLSVIEPKGGVPMSGGDGIVF
jgi:hypothetical protein